MGYQKLVLFCMVISICLAEVLDSSRSISYIRRVHHLSPMVLGKVWRIQNEGGMVYSWHFQCCRLSQSFLQERKYEWSLHPCEHNNEVANQVQESRLHSLLSLACVRQIAPIPPDKQFELEFLSSGIYPHLYEL